MFLFCDYEDMTLHPPKHISSIEGLGLNTTKTMKQINNTVSIGTEIWNELDIPRQEGLRMEN